MRPTRRQCPVDATDGNRQVWRLPDPHSVHGPPVNAADRGLPATLAASCGLSRRPVQDRLACARDRHFSTIGSAHWFVRGADFVVTALGENGDTNGGCPHGERIE